MRKPPIEEGEFINFEHRGMQEYPIIEEDVYELVDSLNTSFDEVLDELQNLHPDINVHHHHYLLKRKYDNVRQNKYFPPM